MKKITIIGAGYAALSAVRKLRQLDATADITVIAPKRGNIALGFSGNPNEPTAMHGGPIFEFL